MRRIVRCRARAESKLSQQSSKTKTVIISKWVRTIFASRSCEHSRYVWIREVWCEGWSLASLHSNLSSTVRPESKTISGLWTCHSANLEVVLKMCGGSTEHPAPMLRRPTDGSRIRLPKCTAPLPYIAVAVGRRRHINLETTKSPIGRIFCYGVSSDEAQYYVIHWFEEC